MMLKKVLNFLSEGNTKLSVILIFVGTLAWSLVSIRNGLLYSNGIYFWGPHAHDGLWHIALASSLSKFSFENPIFAGEVIKNYHIGFDVLLAGLHKITLIPISVLYFQILPPIMSFLIGLLGYKLAYVLSKSKLSATIATFFVYFGGSLGWLVSLMRYGEWGGESMFWSMQSISTPINPPYLLSLIIIFSLLIYLFKRIKLNLKQIILLTLVVVILFEVKAYAGVLLIISLGFIGIVKYLKEKNYDLVLLSVLSFVSIFIVSRLVNIESQKLFQFYPFWFLETLMLFADRLNWEKYFQAMTAYKESGMYLKWLIAIVVSFLIFLLGNLSLRVIGFYEVFSVILKKSSYIEKVLSIMILSGILIPLFLVQRGTPWNTIQFFYYSAIFLGIFTGITLGKALGKYDKSIYIVLCIILFLVTIPTTIIAVSTYTSPRPTTFVSKDELAALFFLKEQPDGIVLFAQYADSDDYKYEGITPIYAYGPTAFIPAYTEKSVYYQDEMNLSIMNYDYLKRKEILSMVLKDPNTESGKSFLREYDISYIYKLKEYGKGLDEKYLNIENIYENESVIIYRVY